MLDMLEVGEASKALVVVLQDSRGLDALDAILGEVWGHLVEDECGDALILVVGAYGNKQEVEVGHLLGAEGLEQMVPAEWEEAAAAFAQSIRERRHTKAHGHDFVVLVGHHSDEVEVEQWEVHLAVVLLLTLGHRLIVVELLIGRVEHIEVAIAIASLQFAHALNLHGVELVAPSDDIHDAAHALGSLGRRGNLELDPILLLDKAVALVVRDVVGMSIEARHRGVVVEALEEQALMVEVGEAQRAIQALHAVSSAPVGNGVEQRAEDLVVVDTLEPTKAALLDIPGLVGAMVDDTHDATHDLVVAIGHIDDVVAHLECGVALGVEGVYLVDDNRRTVVGIPLVEVYAKLHKPAHLALRPHLLNYYSVWV